MCFIKIYKTKKDAEEGRLFPPIAAEPIKVYKRLNMLNQSPYKFFDFRQGTLHESHLNPFTIEQDELAPKGYRLFVQHGLHSHKNLDEAFKYAGHHEHIVEMIIPSGADYYDNGRELISNRLYWPL